MKLIRHAIAVTLAFSGLFAFGQIKVVGDGGPGPVKAQHLTVELLAQSKDVGAEAVVGLSFTLEDGWHVYWVNAGDSGEPPHVKWTLPEGVTAGEMLFPAPGRLPLGPLMDFGYENTVTFPVKLQIAKGVKPGRMHVGAKVDWLVCREVCLPGKADMGIDLNVVPGASGGGTGVGPLAEALAGLPRASTRATVNAGRDDWVITLRTGKRESTGEFYPFDQEVIANSSPQRVELLADGVRVRVAKSPDLKALPKELHGLVKVSNTVSYEFTGPVVAGEVAAEKGAKTEDSSGVTVWTALVLAFVGGIILNLMPCVFPVLFIKALALVRASNEERHRMRAHGWAYTLGILVSFWAIVLILLALRAGGSQLGWGFQLQSPGFIAVLASFLFMFAMSLAGQFDMGLSLTSVGGELTQKEGVTGSFFTGVLATVVATPCTAPLMGAAIGFALAQPAWVTLAVFTMLGMGLALPYVLLSLRPEWTRVLPKPGVWMEVLKQATAVPLFATVIWLTWVYGQLFSGSVDGVSAVAGLLGCFLVLSLAGWVLGRWPGRWSSAVIALAIVVLGLGLTLSRSKTETKTSWVAYSAPALAEARKSGKPVFVDFTAAWCLSCQFNERTVLNSADVQKRFKDGNVVLMKADWTKYDPAITAELEAVGRSGVPTYVIYPAKRAADVLPEVLTKGIVIAALDKDLKEQK